MRGSVAIRWIAFGLCLAVFASALAWISGRAIQLEEQRNGAQEVAAVQETVRLALWRMEAQASAVVVQESARPPNQFKPFHQVEEAIDVAGGANATLRLPSPLLGRVPELTKLHFERRIGPGGALICSPQVPVGTDRELALERFEVTDDLAFNRGRLSELDALLAAHPEWLLQIKFNPLPQEKETLAGVVSIDSLNLRDQAWRQNALVANAVQQATTSTQLPKAKMGTPQSVAVIEDVIGEMNPLWLGDQLFLLRQVRAKGELWLQGVWLDWPAMEQEMLATVADLLPSARLLPVKTGREVGQDWLQLATLPIRLLPGEVSIDVVAATTGVRTALGFAWAAFLIAGLAVAVVLFRAMQLSERRAAFVSAVTHELRTPLTTFRLYSEMLAEEMVESPEQRRSYLRTLCEESSRLMHLVENVLSFSRIERGRHVAPAKAVAISGVLDSVLPRLRARCAEVELGLKVNLEAGIETLLVRADALTIEQILFNLVDNACKYAAPEAEPRTLDLAAEAEADRLVIELRDHGPGLPRNQEKKLFRPFAKSATEAAHSAPGIGLGLALSRQLARELGGDLEFFRPERRGAGFRLTLPRD